MRVCGLWSRGTYDQAAERRGSDYGFCVVGTMQKIENSDVNSA